MILVHSSDCSVNNAPAFTPGPCDCEAKEIEKAMRKGIELGVGWGYADCCVALDNGEDPRNTEMPEVIKRMEEDFNDLGNL